jgi:4-hydroxybenzoate polyprenyltransferase
MNGPVGARPPSSTADQGDSSVAPTPTKPSFAAKWWRYQSERFPIFAHGALIAAFSFCAVSLSRMLRNAPGWPAWPQLLVAFVSCFAFFLQLRIADEFKDFEEDSRYRPYRPVPRGLVTLRELAVLFVILVLIQLALALWLSVRLIPLLLITWTYLAAMSKEFFIADWLRKRHVLYMLSHMVIMPLVDLYATSTDWMTAADHAPRGLIWFLLASYCNGLVIELGRKIRSPQDEEEGVATYSHLWGRTVATMSWWCAMAGTLGFATIVAIRLHAAIIVVPILTILFVAAITIGASFLCNPQPGRGKRIENFSGFWTIGLYLSLGLMPHFFARGAP